MIRRKALLAASMNGGGSSEALINIDNYLTIEAIEDGLTASLSTNACEYCVDGDGNWKFLSAGTATESINSGQTLSFRGNLTPNSSNGIGTFTISKKCNLKGNCMSMIFGDNAVDKYSLSGKDYVFYKLFYSCINIVSVSYNFLPATILASDCYYDMFYSCSSLTTAPELPATALAEACYNGMFYSCSSLTTSPELPATALASRCYDHMFQGCRLTTAPALPATKLEFSCYRYMFQGCGLLTTAPELPATTLASNCYDSMFKGCTSLKTAPELSATTLEYSCYAYMFQDCTRLTTAPALPATKLEYNCYQYMFKGCKSLTTAPTVLPATTLKNSCYYSMFQDCTSLTTSPELPATTLEYSCYKYMFKGCTKLNYIKMLATNISASDCLYNWVDGVASSGTFAKHPDMTTLPTGTSGIPEGWTVANDGEQIVNTDNYLTIEALEDGLTASLSVNACEYCIDGDGNWKSLSAGTATESINTGHTLSFRGNLTPTSSNGIGTFTVNKNFNLKGNVMSMLFGDAGKDNYSLSGKSYAFRQLFYNCINIVNVSDNFLPATTLASTCYRSMFAGCTSLTTAPELPATTLAFSCYESMFYGCTSLTTAPDLPATTLADYCYYAMFGGCTSLTTAPELPATTLADSCYDYMFKDCTSLTTAPSLPATTLAGYCYRYMFRGCTILTTAPELPATTLASNCYYGMFRGCTSLTTAPELPATTLASNCYYDMFRGCSKLNYIKMLATDISATECLYYWVSGVASTGTFVKNPAMNSLPTGSSGIPSGWTVVNDGEESGGNLITFTINSTQYQAEEGMTWEEWINSSYYDQNLNINIISNDMLYIDGDPILRNSLQGVITQYTNTEIVLDGIYNSM